MSWLKTQCFHFDKGVSINYVRCLRDVEDEGSVKISFSLIFIFESKQVVFKKSQTILYFFYGF